MAPCAVSAGYRPLTIPEAAQLVIQAGAMSKGGDVFVLNMGYAPT
jgi:FlaA1/EpsC-like NDP-sugar epimerase